MKRRQQLLDLSPLLLSGAVINPSAIVRELGSLSLMIYQWRLTSTYSLVTFYKLRRIKNCCRALPCMKMLVNWFVISWIDYCNCLLMGSPASTTDGLQRVIHAVITDLRRPELVTPWYATNFIGLKYRNVSRTNCTEMCLVQTAPVDIQGCPWPGSAVCGESLPATLRHCIKAILEVLNRRISTRSAD